MINSRGFTLRIVFFFCNIIIWHLPFYLFCSSTTKHRSNEKVIISYADHSLGNKQYQQNLTHDPKASGWSHRLVFLVLVKKNTRKFIIITMLQENDRLSDAYLCNEYSNQSTDFIISSVLYTPTKKKLLKIITWTIIIWAHLLYV